VGVDFLQTAVASHLVERPSQSNMENHQEWVHHMVICLLVYSKTDLVCKLHKYAVSYVGSYVHVIVTV